MFCFVLGVFFIFDTTRYCRFILSVSSLNLRMNRCSRELLFSLQSVITKCVCVSQDLLRHVQSRMLWGALVQIIIVQEIPNIHRYSNHGPSAAHGTRDQREMDCFRNPEGENQVHKTLLNSNIGQWGEKQPGFWLEYHWTFFSKINVFF